MFLDWIPPVLLVLPVPLEHYLWKESQSLLFPCSPEPIQGSAPSRSTKGLLLTSMSMWPGPQELILVSLSLFFFLRSQSILFHLWPRQKVIVPNTTLHSYPFQVNLKPQHMAIPPEILITSW